MEQVEHKEAPGKRLGLFIDGDNVSADFAGRIIMRSLAHGSPQIRRVYGNAAKMPKWDAAPGFKLVHSGSGKNATDLLLTIEAVDCFLRGQVDGVVVVSSDRDFTHLAEYLRERGVKVVGMGEAKAPASFRKACTHFVELTKSPTDLLEDASTSQQRPPDTAAIGPNTSVLVRSILSGHQSPMPIGQFGSKIKMLHGMTAKDAGAGKWSDYFRERPAIYAVNGVAPNLTVEIKRSAQPAPHTGPGTSRPPH